MIHAPFSHLRSRTEGVSHPVACHTPDGTILTDTDPYACKTVFNVTPGLPPAETSPSPVSPPPQPPPAIQRNVEDSIVVRLRAEGGVFVVPVTINNTLSLNFIVDSGAYDVSIPLDVVLTLMRTGTITEADFLYKRNYTLADGSTVPSQVFRIRSLKVANKVPENVQASVSSLKSPLLLGQSFLSRFKSWRIDNTRHALILE